MTGENILILKKFVGEEVSVVCVDGNGDFLVTGTRNGTGHVCIISVYAKLLI